MLLTCLKSYDKSQFIKDVTAGIIVAIIALPLSIALALASGVGPEAGIFTAIVAGFVISALGGSCVQIAGPTAAFATIVAGIVARDGMDGLIIATIMAGIFLILMGLFHFGSLIKFIPYTITTGFTSGIAVTIVIGQLKDFFGITYPDGVKPIETTEKMKAFVRNISSVNTDALIVGIVSLAILILAPYIFKKVPGSLIAVIVGILMGAFGPRFHLTTYTTMSANLMLRQLGIIIYLAGLGIDSGVHFFETVFRAEGLLWIGLGFLLTIVPVLIVGFIASQFFKLDYAHNVGMLCGSMANPMALSYANTTVDGDEPSVSYATVYPLSMFIRVISAQLVLMLFT